MIGLALEIIFNLLPFLVAAIFLFSDVLKDLFKICKEQYRIFIIRQEYSRREKLLTEMKQLGYKREDMTHSDLEKLEELLKQEFPALYKDEKK